MDGVGGLQAAKVGQSQHYIGGIGQLSAGRYRLLDIDVGIRRAVVVRQRGSHRHEVRNEEVTVGRYQQRVSNLLLHPRVDGIHNVDVL